MATTTVEPAARVPFGTLARAGLAGIVAGLALVAAVRLLAGVVLPVAGLDPYGWVPAVGSVLAFGVGATVVYAILDRYAANARRSFLVAAGVVFALMLVPVFVVGPSLGADTLALQAGLVALHVAAAVGIVGGLLAVVDRAA